MAIHKIYRILEENAAGNLRVDRMKSIVDSIADDLIDALKEADFNAPGDDTIEVVVEAIAKYIYEANLQ